MDQDFLINIHSIIPCSRINGPGNRLIIFFQGCDIKCQGCFNPATHTFDDMNLCHPSDIFERYLRQDIEGVTISGGEPFYQARKLLSLLKIAKEFYGLSTIVYTGFTYERLKKIRECLLCFEFIDVLIDGRYEESKKETTLLARGSSNQRFYFFTNRYKQANLYMRSKTEVLIGKDGTITKTGFNEVDF
jgi:anaerobic ribonucleoside-triphosphate reductase activating protein